MKKLLLFGLIIFGVDFLAIAGSPKSFSDITVDSIRYTGNNSIQIASPTTSSSGSGYAVEPATIAFRLDQGVSASTGNFTSTITVAGLILGQRGTPGSPAFSVLIDSDTGIYFIVNNIRFATNGIGYVEINNIGNLNPLTASAQDLGTVPSQKWRELNATSVNVTTAVFTSSITIGGDAIVGNNIVAQRVGGNIFTMTASSVSASSTGEINLVAIGSGTVTIPSTFWTVGKSLAIKGAGFYSSTTTTPGNFSLRIKIGTTVILSTTSVGYVVTQSSQVFGFSTTLTCRATGSSGSVIGQTIFVVYDTTNGARALPGVAASPVTVDLSASRDISFTWQDSVSDALNTKTLTNFTVDSK